MITDVYEVWCSGNEFKYRNCNRKPCVSRCLRFANKGFYVELWYVHSNGSRVLVKFWN